MRAPTKQHAPTCRCNACALQRLKASNTIANARHRENVREVGRENVRDFRERVEGRSLEDWHRDTDT